MKYYIVIEDLQGGEFGMGRIYTEEQWREQALEWASMDDDYGLFATLQTLSTDNIIPFISEMWDLEFRELTEEETELFNQAVKDYKELESIVNNWKGTPEELHKKVGGYNWDNELFDCNYKSITATIWIEPFRVCNGIDIWGKNDIVFENITL